MNVAIVGAGPAGMLAAWGAYGFPNVSKAAGHIDIFDAEPGIDLGRRVVGLQYLHEPCNLEFVARKIQLRYTVEGNITDPWFPADRIAFIDPKQISPKSIWQDTLRRAYNNKLGRPLDEENSTRFISDDPVNVWSLKDAYRYLFDYFKNSIKRRTLRWSQIVGELSDRYDLVISTAPLPKLFPLDDWPVRLYKIAVGYSPVEKHPDNTCIYNLDSSVPWFRSTRMDGSTATEFVDKLGSDPSWEVLDLGNWLTMRKVVTKKMDLHLPKNVILAGRWGTWDAKELTHNAYRKAKEAVLARSV